MQRNYYYRTGLFLLTLIKTSAEFKVIIPAQLPCPNTFQSSVYSPPLTVVRQYKDRSYFSCHQSNLPQGIRGKNQVQLIKPELI